jgi:hypothetical protein
VKNGMRADARPLTDRDIILDHSKRSDLHTIADRGLGAHGCASINLNRHYFEDGF